MQIGQMPSRYNRIAYQTIIETIILLNSNYDDLVLMK